MAKKTQDPNQPPKATKEWLANAVKTALAVISFPFYAVARLIQRMALGKEGAAKADEQAANYAKEDARRRNLEKEAKRIERRMNQRLWTSRENVDLGDVGIRNVEVYPVAIGESNADLGVVLHLRDQTTFTLYYDKYKKPIEDLDMCPKPVVALAQTIFKESAYVYNGNESLAARDFDNPYEGDFIPPELFDLKLNECPPEPKQNDSKPEPSVPNWMDDDSIYEDDVPSDASESKTQQENDKQPQPQTKQDITPPDAKQSAAEPNGNNRPQSEAKQSEPNVDPPEDWMNDDSIYEDDVPSETQKPEADPIAAEDKTQLSKTDLDQIPMGFFIKEAKLDRADQITFECTFRNDNDVLALEISRSMHDAAITVHTEYEQLPSRVWKGVLHNIEQEARRLGADDSNGIGAAFCTVGENLKSIADGPGFCVADGTIFDSKEPSNAEIFMNAYESGMQYIRVNPENSPDNPEYEIASRYFQCTTDSCLVEEDHPISTTYCGVSNDGIRQDICVLVGPNGNECFTTLWYDEDAAKIHLQKPMAPLTLGKRLKSFYNDPDILKKQDSVDTVVRTALDGLGMAESGDVVVTNGLVFSVRDEGSSKKITVEDMEKGGKSVEIGVGDLESGKAYKTVSGALTKKMNYRPVPQKSVERDAGEER